MSIFNSIPKDLPESKKISQRQQILRKLRPAVPSDSPFFTPLLFDENLAGQKNCENLVGQISLPVGLAGPVSATLKVKGQIIPLTNLFLPLATTEGALVASLNRGAKVLNQAEATTVTVTNVGMTRAPVFACPDSQSALSLITWIKSHLRELADLAESTSSHLTYLSCRMYRRNNLVFARFAFDPDEAMGMNMVTFAASAIAEAVIKANPHVTCPALSSNICADKKTSALNRRLGRGRWVTVTTHLSESLITTLLKTTPAALLSTYHAKIVVGSKLAGLSGANMQLANAASAVLAATGQDLAHTVDISQGTLTLTSASGGVSASLSLPSVPVGTVGGGTGLTTQSVARSLISLEPVTGDVLAAVIGLACLAGELSGLAALSTNSLARAHAQLAR
jgi:hydroxymethylglutaryl-CoA reductase (NADPH)